MCGLVGILTNEQHLYSAKRQLWLSDALTVNTVRGYDSTGLALIPHNKNAQIQLWKETVTGGEFIKMPELKKELDKVEKFKYFIGHNRKATVGGVTNETAHPFWIDDIILTHNGTLNNYTAFGTNFVSDSEAIANAMATMSAEAVISKLNGAYALVWHDERDGKVRMVRNKERTLFFATVKDQETVLYASEAHMLHWLAVRHGIELDIVYVLPVDTLVEFNPDKVRDFTAKTVQPYQHKVVNYYNYTSTNTHKGYTYPQQNQKVTNINVKKADRELMRSIGVKKKEVVKLIMTDFKSYSDGKFGTLYGTILTSPYASVEVYGVKEADVSDKSIYSGKVRRVFVDNNGEVIAQLDDYKIVGNNGEAIRNNLFGTDTDTDDIIPELPDIDAVVSTANKIHITKQEAKKCCSNGCGMCGDHLEVEDVDTMHLIGNDTMICKGCIDLYNTNFVDMAKTKH